MGRAIKKYGIENFTFEVLETCPIECLYEIELKYIKIYQCFKEDIGYNIVEGGRGGYGTKHTEESKRKISEYRKTTKLSDEQKKKFSFKGRKHSDESKKKASESLKGRIVTLEQRRKSSEAKKGKIRLEMRGGLHRSAKFVLNIETGIFYDCAKDASFVLGMNYNTFKGMLSGRRKNKTTMIYA
jgi:group I intron endonuclease